MERDQAAATSNLMDREERLIADLLHRFSNLVILATEPITNRATAGQAAYNSMAMDMETKGMIKSAEDLLSLTRLLRELWVIGPLRRPGEGEQEAEEKIEQDVKGAVALANKLRQDVREKMVSKGRHGKYVSAALEAPRIDGGGLQPGLATAQASQANASG